LQLIVVDYHAVDPSDDTTSQSSVTRPPVMQRTIFINQPQSRTYYSNKVRYLLVFYLSTANLVYPECQLKYSETKALIPGASNKLGE